MSTMQRNEFPINHDGNRGGTREGVFGRDRLEDNWNLLYLEKVKSNLMTSF